MNHRLRPLGFLICGLLILVSLLSPHARAGIQGSVGAGSRIPLAEGTHLFRRILYNQGLAPLTEQSDLQTNLKQLKVDPEHTLLILLGETNVLSTQELEDFLRQGGAALVATDRPTPGHFAGVAVVGESVSVDPASDYAYKHLADCIFLQGEANSPVFAGLRFSEDGKTRVCTNRPSYLTSVVPLGLLNPMASLPQGCTVRDRQIGKPLSFAWGGDYRTGRILVLADHSLFINAMMCQQDLENFDFADNCVAWLAGQGHRKKKVLFIEEGMVQTKFDIPVRAAMPKNIPVPLEAAIHAFDHGAQGMEEENLFNRAVASGLPRRLDPWEHTGWIKKLLLIVTVVLVVYGLMRAIQGRRSTEPGILGLRAGLAQLVRVLSVSERRHRDFLRQENFWEPGQTLVRELFRSALGPVTDFSGKPRVDARGSWPDRWHLRHETFWMWRLAGRPQPARLSLKQLNRLRTRAAHLQRALADGSLRIEVPTGARLRDLLRATPVLSTSPSPSR